MHSAACTAQHAHHSMHSTAHQPLTHLVSRKSGRASRRSVWPVGAVSNTMRVKRAYSGSCSREAGAELAQHVRQPRVQAPDAKKRCFQVGTGTAVCSQVGQQNKRSLTGTACTACAAGPALTFRNWMTLAMAIASSMPGGGVSSSSPAGQGRAGGEGRQARTRGQAQSDSGSGSTEGNRFNKGKTLQGLAKYPHR